MISAKRKRSSAAFRTNRIAHAPHRHDRPQDRRNRDPPGAEPRRQRARPTSRPAWASSTTCSTLLARHAAIDLTVEAKGDLHVDQHHTVEDVGICFGQALKQALGDKAGIRRYGHFTLPMEETLVTTAIDLERPLLPGVSGRRFPSPKIGDFDSELVEDFWQAVAANALCNLHVLVHYGRNSHHISEAIFKATARALRMAVEPDPRITGVPSTKGTLG